MSDDLTKYEIDQINRVDAKLSETKQKTNQAAARFEEKFKQVALAIAQLYSTIGGSQSPEAYNAFNNAAIKLTEFYTEIKDAKNFENKQGYVTKEREVLKWAKTRKKQQIRRDELIANVTGTSIQRPGSYYNESRGSSPPHAAHSRTHFSRSRGSPQRRSPRPSTSIRNSKSFRNDGGISSIQETMGNFTMSSPPRSENRKRNFQIFDDAVNDVLGNKRVKYS
jgi:hypothetical protein